MKTTDYKVGDTVMLSDGKKYTYMGERTAICGIKSHDYEPIEFNISVVQNDAGRRG